MPHRRLPAALALALVLTGGCAGADAPSAAPSASTASPPAASPSAPAAAAAPTASVSAAPGDSSATVDVAPVEPYGDVLVDQAQQTLYVFTADSSATSACDGTCADNWPPVVSGGPPIAAGAVRGGLLATVVRTDGSLQASYDGRPLYRYSGDSAPGDALGAGLGDRWYPVRPDGTLADGSEGARDGGNGS